MKKKWKSVLILFLFVFFVFRFFFSEEYVLLTNGIYRNQIMYEEIFRDEAINNEERVKIILYRSNDKNRIGMMSLRKENILFFSYYRYYQKFEYNQQENGYLYTTQELKDKWRDLWGKNRSVVENGSRILFSDHYRTFPNGIFNGEVYRNIYCGKVENYQKVEWLEDIAEDDFRYQYEDGNSLYFVIDTENHLSGSIE